MDNLGICCYTTKYILNLDGGVGKIRDFLGVMKSLLSSVAPLSLNAPLWRTPVIEHSDDVDEPVFSSCSNLSSSNVSPADVSPATETSMASNRLTSSCVIAYVLISFC